MPNMNISFGGNTEFQPGVYYQDNVSTYYVPSNQFTLPVIYIGYGYNGASGVPYTFNTPQDLLNFIRGGPASGYVNPLFNPSTTLAGTNNVTFIPVGLNTPATFTIDSVSGAAEIYLTTATSGVPSNMTQVEVAAGTFYPEWSVNMTLYDGYSGTTYTGNNLGVPLQIAYTGDASGVTYAITANATGSYEFVLYSPNSDENFTIPLGASTYATVTDLVEYINGTGYYTAGLISDTGGLLPSTSLNPSGATMMSPAGTGSLVYYPVVAVPYDATFWVNQYASTIATATSSLDSSDTAAIPLEYYPLTHFSGATSTPPTNSSYAECFNAALNVSGWVVFADENTLAVQTLGAQHAETASETVYGQWRRFFTGSNVGDSIPTTLANAAALNSIETCYVYPGVKVVNTATSQIQTLGGLYAAAMAAGIASANQVALPLTNKGLNAVSVEYSLTASEINQLQIGGVMPIALLGANSNTPTIVSDYTTWQSDANPLNVFTQQIACRWWLAYTMRNALQPFIGGIASPDTLTQIANAAKTALNNSVYTPGSQGVLASWDATTLVVSYNGQTQQASVAATAVTVGQYRFITETVTIQLYSGSASTSTPTA